MTVSRVLLAIALMAPASQVEASPCSGEIKVVGGGAEWQRAAGALQVELAARADVEHCVEIVVRVGAGDRDTVVTVELGGRRATRTLEHPDDMRAMLLSLLLSPVSAVLDTRSEPLPAAPPTSPAGTTSYDVLEHVDRDEPSFGVTAAASATPGVATSIDVALAMGAFYFGHGMNPSVGALVKQEWGGWSIAVHGRLVARQQPGKSTPTVMSSPTAVSWRELGAEFGHRFALGSLALEPSFGPDLVAMEQSDDVVRRATTIRASGSVRVTSASMRRLGAFVAFDASVGLGIISSTSDQPELPTWSVGAAFGGELRIWR